VATNSGGICFRRKRTIWTCVPWATLILVIALAASDLALAQVCTPNIALTNCGVPGHICPNMISAAPPIVSAGVRQQRLTITGTNFRPGAHVLITIPNGDPSALAPDVTVESTTVVNGGLIYTVIDVNRLGSGIRSVDVVNADCTNTANSNLNIPGPSPSFFSTHELFITGTNSLAGPVQVDNLVVTYPRDGTVVQEGEDLYGEAVLAGAGTGMVTGMWIWDGNVNEQFTANLSGGESTVVRTSVPLPTFYLGRHTLELAITSPQNIQSRLVRVFVDSGEFKLLRLLLPASGEGFSDANPPTLRWTPIPGAAKYEVGFSSQPFFDGVSDWHEASDNIWKVPEKIWSRLPEGELYWTVRPIEMSGQSREPARMRSIWHVQSGLLGQSTEAHLSPSGSVLLDWRGLRERVFYRLTITRGQDGNDVVRRYLTASTEADLYAIRETLQPGQTFYWQVQAVSPVGRVIAAGQRQSFVVPAQHAEMRHQTATLRLASFRVPSIYADLAASIRRQSPASGTNVSSNQPPVGAEFSQPIDPTKLALSVDGTDVTAVADVKPNSVGYSPVFPLDNGEHTVQVDVGSDSQNWKFQVVYKEPPPPLAPNPTAKNDAEVVTRNGIASAKAPGEIGPDFKTHFGFNPQLGSSPTPNQIELTGGEQMTFQEGAWRVELNGTLAMDALLSPSPQHLYGRVQDYTGQIAYKQKPLGIGMRFGLLAPDLYTDSQFISTAVARQAVEPQVTTPAGTFSYYANSNDVTPGAGDASAFNQIIRGAGYEAPIPTKWGELRAMWMNSRDQGTPFAVTPINGGLVPNSSGLQATTLDQQASPGNADAYGGLLKLRLPSEFTLTSEYAVAYDSPNLAPFTFPPPTDPNGIANPPYATTPIPINGPVTCSFAPQLIAPGFVPEACGVGPGGKRQFGRAWRSGLSGTWKKTTINVAYRDVTPNFSTPANPGFTPLSSPGRQGLDSTVTQGTPIGNFTVGYQYLESIASMQGLPTTLFHNLTWGWKKGFKTKTQFALAGHEVRTNNSRLPSSLQSVDPLTLLSENILIDQRDVGFTGSVQQKVGSFSLNGGASRDWFRNRDISGQNSIVTGTQFGAAWKRQSVFQLQANVSASWAVRDKATIGDTRILSLYLMPMFMSQHTGLSLTPLASVNQIRGSLGTGMMTANMLTSQLGGRVSWRLPSIMRSATFSFEGARTQMQNSLATTTMPSFNLIDKRLAVLLSFSHDQNQGRL
jgi:hypothetical protein